MGVALVNQITLAVAFLGLAIWLGLYLKARKEGISFHTIFLCLVIIGLFGRTMYAVFTPAFYAPDEQAHFNYVQYLIGHKKFPVQEENAAWQDNEYEYYQPPLYYVVSAVLAAPFFFLKAGDESILFFLRFLNIGIWFLNLIVVMKIIRAIKLRNEFYITLVVAFFALLPTYTSNTSVVNNDNLPILLGHVFLLTCLKLPSGKMVLPAGILLGLALLSKLTAVIFGIWTGIFMLCRLIDRKVNAREAILQPALIAAIAFLCWLPWGLRNLGLYNEFTATEWGNFRPDGSLREEFEFHFLYSINSFWSVAGQFNNLTYMLKVGKGILFASLLGLLYYLLKHRNRIIKVLDHDKRLLKYFALAGIFSFVINYLLMLKFGITYGQGQGRFLYTTLLPFSFIVAMGLLEFRKFIPHWHIHLAGLLIVYNMTYLCYTLLTFTRIV